MDLVARLMPPPHRRSTPPGLLEGQALPASRSASPAWQDAIVGAYAGMADTGSTYLRADRERRPRRRRGRRALVGPRASGSSRSPTWSSAARRSRAAGSGRRASRSCRTASARTSRPPCSAPYLDRCGHATGNAGHSFVDADGAARRSWSRCSTPRASRCTSTRIGDRGVREALDAFAAHGTPGTSATCATTSRTSRSSTPTTCRASPSSASPPTPQALWACPRAADGRADHPVPRRRSAPTWQYPFGGLHRAGARLVMGSDWPVTSPDPLAAIHIAVDRARRTTTRGASRSCRSRRST